MQDALNLWDKNNVIPKLAGLCSNARIENRKFVFSLVSFLVDLSPFSLVGLFLLGVIIQTFTRFDKKAKDKEK